MKVLFTPDIFKYDEEFVLEGDTLDEVIDKLKEEFPYNCVLSVNILLPRTLTYLGLLQLEEGKEPEWLKDDSITLFTESEE